MVQIRRLLEDGREVRGVRRILRRVVRPQHQLVHQLEGAGALGRGHVFVDQLLEEGHLYVLLVDCYLLVFIWLFRGFFGIPGISPLLPRSIL